MMQGSQLAVRPEANRAIARIISGAHFTCLLIDDKQQRATALEAVLETVTDPTTRVIWVGNPLRSPLTIERFLIQIVGPEVDLRIDRSPAQLVKLMTQPLGDESRLLVVVQQPETMGAEARDILTAIPPHLAGSTLQMQFLFVGAANFTLMTFTESATASIAATPQPVASGKPFLTRLYVLLPLTLLLGVGLGVSGIVAVSNLRSQLAAQASPETIPPPVVAATVAPAQTLATAPVAVVPAPAPDLTALRREFDAFLAKRAPTTPPMTDSQKDSLFREFLAQRRSN